MTRVESVNCAAATEDTIARRGMYRLLARLWIREVDRELLSQLQSAPILASLEGAGGVVPSVDDSQAIEQLAIDYCRLFIGPSRHLPPYQSVWQDGQLLGDASVSMQRYIDAVGYDVDGLPTGVMLDHFGVQLDLMGFVLGHITRQSTEAIRQILIEEVADDFFRAHLQWSVTMLEAIVIRATTEFYRSTALLTLAFLDCEGPEGRGSR